MERKQLGNLVLLALFVALIVLLGFTPLGLIPLGFINVTILCVPVIVGTLYMGWKNGLILGLAFGLTSFASALMKPSALVSTLMGASPVLVALMSIVPRLLVPLAAIFFVTLACGKMVSLASVLCAAAYPLVTFCYQQFFLHAPAAQVGAASVGAAVVGLLVIWLHRGNIARIRAGTEYKFFQKKK